MLQRILSVANFGHGNNLPVKTNDVPVERTWIPFEKAAPLPTEKQYRLKPLQQLATMRMWGCVSRRTLRRIPLNLFRAVLDVSMNMQHW